MSNSVIPAVDSAQSDATAQPVGIAQPVEPVQPTIASAFADRKALIGFVTAGDPTLDTTRQLVIGMAEAGCDLVELGIPFSDPVAEGPVIQEASLRSLQGGTTLDGIFGMVAQLRESCSVPLVFMGYMNPVLHYGMDRFFARCRDLGVAGIIVADVPYEERDEVADVAARYGVDFISMLAPTSDERIERVATGARGFLYLVSSLGVTGMRSEITTDIPAIVGKIREVTDIPVAVGFGIGSPQQAHAMAHASDGAIVGSAIVRLIAEYGENAVEPVKEFVASLRAGIDEGLA